MGRSARYQETETYSSSVAAFLTVADPSLSWEAPGSPSLEGVLGKAMKLFGGQTPRVNM